MPCNAGRRLSTQPARCSAPSPPKTSPSPSSPSARASASPPSTAISPPAPHINIACGLDLLSQLDHAIDRLNTQFATDPETTFDHFVWALVHNGIGTLVAVLVPEDPEAVPDEVIQRRAELLTKVDAFLTRAARVGLVPPHLTADQLAAELFVVTRPQNPNLFLMDPDVRDRLVGRLLFCWRNQR